MFNNPPNAVDILAMGGKEADAPILRALTVIIEATRAAAEAAALKKEDKGVFFATQHTVDSLWNNHIDRAVLLATLAEQSGNHLEAINLLQGVLDGEKTLANEKLHIAIIQKIHHLRVARIVALEEAPSDRKMMHTVVNEATASLKIPEVIALIEGETPTVFSEPIPETDSVKIENLLETWIKPFLQENHLLNGNFQRFSQMLKQIAETYLTMQNETAFENEDWGLKIQVFRYLLVKDRFLEFLRKHGLPANFSTPLAAGSREDFLAAVSKSGEAETWGQMKKELISAGESLAITCINQKQPERGIALLEDCLTLQDSEDKNERIERFFTLGNLLSGYLAKHEKEIPAEDLTKIVSILAEIKDILELAPMSGVEGIFTCPEIAKEGANADQLRQLQNIVAFVLMRHAHYQNGDNPVLKALNLKETGAEKLVDDHREQLEKKEAVDPENKELHQDLVDLYMNLTDYYFNRQELLYAALYGQKAVETAKKIGNYLALKVYEALKEQMIEAISAATEKNVEMQEKMLYALASFLEGESDVTGQHIKRTSLYAGKLAKLCGMPPEIVEKLRYAAFFHDAGKIQVPDAIRLSKKQYTDEQRSIMGKHTEHGHCILRRMAADDDNCVFATAATIARYHHEKYDGTGYPEGLKGEEIPFEGRLMKIVDVFDALLDPAREYREGAWALGEVVQTFINDVNTHFDPALMRIFLRHLGRFLEIRAEINKMEDAEEEILAAEAEVAGFIKKYCERETVEKLSDQEFFSALQKAFAEHFGEKYIRKKPTHSDNGKRQD